jgi:nucleotide-binding universal stress UspA family protein
LDDSEGDRRRCAVAIEPYGPVVVGVDASPGSLAAVDLAAEEAMARVAPLIVVHAVDGHGVGSDGRVDQRPLALAVARPRRTSRTVGHT